MFISRKRFERAIDDAYGDGFASGIEMGYVAAETNIKNYIAELEGMDWLLDELDDMYPEDDSE